MAADEVYGADPGLRGELERRGVGYVLAVACSHPVTTAAGRLRADAIATSLPRRAWQRLSAGAGSKGPRWYDGAWISIQAPDANHPGSRWLLIRRNYTTGELGLLPLLRTWPVPLATLVRIAGRRWTIEESFQPAKASPGSTNTDSAAGSPGTAGPSWPCSPTPTSLSWPQPNAPASAHPRA